MATSRRPTTNPATTTESPAELGVFVTTTPVGYTTSTPEEIVQINRLLREVPVQTLDRTFFNNLLLIKLLAPEESKELFIYPAPMVVEFVGRLKTRLTMRYYGG